MTDLRTLMDEAFDVAVRHMAAAREANRRDLASLPVLRPESEATPREFTIEPGVTVFFPEFVSLVIFDADGTESFAVEGPNLAIRGRDGVYFRNVDLG
jgi:hypothetical protein